MKRVEKVVINETLYIAAWVVVFSALTQAVFLMIGQWDYTVLLGNLFGAACAVGNFFAMAYSVQLAVEKDEKDAKGLLKLSQTLRFLGLFVLAAVGYMIPFMHTVAVVVPFVFPSLGVFLRPLFKKGE